MGRKDKRTKTGRPATGLHFESNKSITSNPHSALRSIAVWTPTQALIVRMALVLLLTRKKKSPRVSLFSCTCYMLDLYCTFQFIHSSSRWRVKKMLEILIIYRVSQEECARLRESVPYVKVYRYNPKHLYPKLNSYGDNGQRSLKLWQLLHAYWLPNTY